MTAQPSGLGIVEETQDALAAYATVSIAFRVERILRVQLLERGLDGVHLIEEDAAQPYVKDDDQLKGEEPTRWAKRWDIKNWGIFAAFEGDERVGGAVVAWNTPGLDMLGGRDDVAALWDIRVGPAHRGAGIGGALFRRAASWAKERGCTHHRDAEHQRTRVRLLRRAALRPRSHQPLRIPRPAGRDAPHLASRARRLSVGGREKSGLS
ncbi:MAG: GNAT family N-acetyltransferase [Dehalococcoidia bacterium]|nr:GNAT family N-acetyltransferase [Dehalococcoidia bacterium]